ncbi:aminoglycoside phosphotransferase family protein [Kribbella sp. NPDC051770]|uniref:phosphotransferase family protein n=1 Tax=Kribbella sp. NPDC051770 TaxID=3155413 RepID=UPI0034420FD7
MIEPGTMAWVERQLPGGERVTGVEVLHGGLTAAMRRLHVEPGRDLVLRTYVGADYAVEDLERESTALRLLVGGGVTAPELIAVDAKEHMSLLMTHLPGRPVYVDAGLEARLLLLAEQLVWIHRTQLAERLPEFKTWTTAETVVVPDDGDADVWRRAIDVIRAPKPEYDGCFLHRDFHPGNVLFDDDAEISGVVDWAGACWGPADLDVAHCCTNLALLHGPEWAPRFVAAYEKAGGVLADEDDHTYWLIRDALSFSEDLGPVAQVWRQMGRPELTTQLAAERLDTYLTMLLS